MGQNILLTSLFSIYLIDYAKFACIYSCVTCVCTKFLELSARMRVGLVSVCSVSGLWLSVAALVF